MELHSQVLLQELDLKVRAAEYVNNSLFWLGQYIKVLPSNLQKQTSFFGASCSERTGKKTLESVGEVLRWDNLAPFCEEVCYLGLW